MKTPIKRELQQVALNRSSDNEFKNFLKLYKDHTKESFSFLVSNVTLPSDNALRFSKNLL